jgi:hypothetical protein
VVSPRPCGADLLSGWAFVRLSQLLLRLNTLPLNVQ